MKTLFIFLFSFAAILTGFAQQAPNGVNISGSMQDIQPDGSIHIPAYTVIGDTIGIPPSNLPIDTAANNYDVSGGPEAVITGFDGNTLQGVDLTGGGSTVTSEQFGPAAPSYAYGNPGAQRGTITTTTTLSYAVSTDGSGNILVTYSVVVSGSAGGSTTGGIINTGVNAWAIPIAAELGFTNAAYIGGQMGVAGATAGDGFYLPGVTDNAQTGGIDGTGAAMGAGGVAGGLGD